MATKLERSENETEKWRAISDSLKQQVEDLRRELEDNKAAAKRHLEAEVARVTAEWRSKLEAEVSEAAAVLASTLQEVETQSRSLITRREGSL